MLESRGDIQSEVPPVMFLGDHLGYASGVAHGATTYFINVLPELRRAGVALTTCFLREPHPAATTLRESGIDPIFLSAKPLDPLVVFKVAKLARERGCKIIHGGGIKATLVARMVAPLVGAKAVVHVHDLSYPSTAVSLLHRLFSRRSDIGLCVSGAVQKVAAKGYHIDSDRLRVAYNGIRLESIRNISPDVRSQRRAELGIAMETRVIAMVGRMHPVKGHQGMLEMLPRIVASCPDVLLLLVGDGPQRAAYEKLSADLGIGHHVRFLGQRDDVAEWLATADIAVMPSVSEGMGLAAVEALAAGKPVVAYGVGGLSEVVRDGVDGVVVPPANQDEFVRAVASLLHDSQRIVDYGKRAAAAAERFSLDRHVQKLLECYRELSTVGTQVALGPP